MGDGLQRTTSSGAVNFNRADVSNEQNEEDKRKNRMLEGLVMKQDHVDWDLAAFPQDTGEVKTQVASSLKEVSNAKVASSVKRKNKNDKLLHKDDPDKQTQLMKDENNEMRRKLQCIICMETYVDVVTLPCCHLCTCKACAGDIQECPSCRAAVKYLLKATL